MASDRDLFLAYGALMTGAILPIYHGAFASLRTPLSTRKALKKARKSRADLDDDEADEDESLTLPEKLTAEDAYWLPVIGSLVLFSMFLVFKYLDKLWVDRVLGFYFGVVGTFAVTKVLLLLARGTGLLKLFTASRFVLTQTKPDPKTKKAQTSDLLALRLTVLHPPILISAVSVVGFYILTRHWIASNVIALSLSLSSISMLSLDSFKTGGIMLMGLFVYDIFWVFGTNVMVSVARGFDAPIKIVWPKNLFAGILSKNTKWQMTMLGLGDIVIPGIFVALALRFDQHLYVQAHPKRLITKRDTTFAKPYFQATVIGYIAGLATTMGVMHFTKAAQPALLYLSPACILSVAICAARRGELAQVWAWTEESEEEEEKKGSKKDTGKSSNKKTSEAAEDNEQDWEDGAENGTVSGAEESTTSGRKSGAGGGRRRKKSSAE